jgi:CspA family cold shock protein
MSSKGTIKRIVSDKGFGFVADDSGQEYFFHQSACQSFDSLREGQAVTFQTGQGPKGPRAENVREAYTHRYHFGGGRHGALSSNLPPLRLPPLSSLQTSTLQITMAAGRRSAPPR